jgi:hypothetical protein
MATGNPPRSTPRARHVEVTSIGATVATALLGLFTAYRRGATPKRRAAGRRVGICNRQVERGAGDSERNFCRTIGAGGARFARVFPTQSRGGWCLGRSSRAPPVEAGREQYFPGVQLGQRQPGWGGGRAAELVTARVSGHEPEKWGGESAVAGGCRARGRWSPLWVLLLHAVRARLGALIINCKLPVLIVLKSRQPGRVGRRQKNQWSGRWCWLRHFMRFPRAG